MYYLIALAGDRTPIARVTINVVAVSRQHPKSSHFIRVAPKKSRKKMIITCLYTL